MRFPIVFTVLACGVMALAAAVAPDALVSRSDSGISKVISTLDKTLNILLPKLDDCEDSKCTEGVVVEIAAAIDGATHTTVDLKGVVSWRFAKEIVDIVIKISVELDSHKSSCHHGCVDIAVYAKVNVSLSSLLKELEVIVYGISSLVGFVKDKLHLG